MDWCWRLLTKRTLDAPHGSLESIKKAIQSPPDPQRGTHSRKGTRKRTQLSSHQDSCIFVAGDGHVSVSTLAAILQKSGFSARFFACPGEALAAARSEAPDLLQAAHESGHNLHMLLKPAYPSEILAEIKRADDETLTTH
jgi:hypothetical protein